MEGKKELNEEREASDKLLAEDMQEEKNNQF